MRKLLISLSFIFYGCQLAPICLAVEKNAWRSYEPDSAAALEFVRKYIQNYHYDINLIRNLAASLQKEHRLLEVVNLYEAAFAIYPNNREIAYRLKLAKSDLQEEKSVKTFNHQQYKKLGFVNLRELDEIKCQSLSNEEGIKACKRLGKVKHEPKLANNTHLLLMEKSTSPAIEVSKNIESKNETSELSYMRDVLANLEIGDFHALIIGNNRYKHFPNLETAVWDAKAVADVLKSKYGFKVTQLENASRYEIFQKLSQFRRQLNDKDNFLIYYAGHGYLDEDTQRGYWLPTDAEKDNYANWLSTSDITDMLNGMSAAHVLVVADSCYSGTLTRGLQVSSRSIDSDQLKWIQRIAKKKSRTVMTSGGLEPVLDSGGGNHSIFTKAFINALVENESILEASRMFATVRRSVILNADQTPEYADIRKAGHEGGDFIFMRVN